MMVQLLFFIHPICSSPIHCFTGMLQPLQAALQPTLISLCAYLMSAFFGVLAAPLPALGFSMCAYGKASGSQTSK